MAELTIQEWETMQAKLNTLKSRRLKILKAMQMILETITVDRGYTMSVAEVTMDSKSWRDVSAPQTPIIFIMDDVVQINRYVAKGRDYTWTVRLFGVVKETSLDEFEEFIADVEQCLEDNSHLCGMVSKCEINQVITDNQMFENTNTRLFELEVQCEYRRCLNNPR